MFYSFFISFLPSLFVWCSHLKYYVNLSLHFKLTWTWFDNEENIYYKWELLHVYDKFTNDKKIN